MPKAIVLEPLVISKLMIDPNFMYVSPTYIAVAVPDTGHIIVIPGEYMDRSEEEIQKVLQYALTDLAR